MTPEGERYEWTRQALKAARVSTDPYWALHWLWMADYWRDCARRVRRHRKQGLGVWS